MLIVLNQHGITRAQLHGIVVVYYWLQLVNGWGIV